jgi:hypothetical protein
MPDINTHIAINAPPAKVWAVLMDFPEYRKWNPFITSIHGEATPGSQLQVNLCLSHNKIMRFDPIVQIVGDYDFSWRGKLYFDGLFDGDHHFKVEAAESGCVFKHSERFSGILPALMGRAFFASLKDRFILMNQALKNRAEMLNAATSAATAVVA